MSANEWVRFLRYGASPPGTTFVRFAISGYPVEIRTNAKAGLTCAWVGRDKSDRPAPDLSLAGAVFVRDTVGEWRVVRLEHGPVAYTDLKGVHTPHWVGKGLEDHYKEFTNPSPPPPRFMQA